MPLSFGQRREWLALLAASLANLACGAGPERLQLADPGRTLTPSAEWRAGLGAAPRGGRLGPAFVVGASGSELIAARLDRDADAAERWRVEALVTAGPVLASERVFFGSGDRVRVLAVEDARELRALPAPGSTLLAAAADGDTTALLSIDRRGERVLSVYDARARERLRIRAEAALGAPAFTGDVLLVPWANGYLSAIDVSAASERARVRIGQTGLQPLWLGGVLFLGGPPWVKPGAPDAPLYALPARPLPGPIQSGPVPLAPEPTGAAATGSPAASPPPEPTRLVVWPAQGDAPAPLYLGIFGRVAFGLEREQGALAWVNAMPGRVLDAAPVAGGFLVCDDSGHVSALAADTGRVERSWKLRRRRSGMGERPLSACALASGVVLAAEPARAAHAEPSLLDQLARVLGLSDPALTEAQRFLARELAARPEPEATRVLIDLVMRNALDRRLQSEAEDLLATRRNGERHMLEALAQSADGALPPIAPLGEALAALGERSAAPLLARQLNRPAHTAQAVARAAAALESLASEAEYDELSVFFSLHRTTADGPEWVAAVLSSARTVQRIGGEKARTLLTFAERDPLTVGDVRVGLQRALRAAPDAIGARAPTP